MMASVPSLVTSFPGYVTTSVSRVRVSKLRSWPSSFGNLTSLLFLEISRVFSPSSWLTRAGSSLRLLPETFRVWRFFKLPMELGSCLSLLFCKYKAWGENSQCELWVGIEINDKSHSGPLLSHFGNCFSIGLTLRLVKRPRSSDNLSIELLRRSRTCSSWSCWRSPPAPKVESSLSWEADKLFSVFRVQTSLGLINNWSISVYSLRFYKLILTCSRRASFLRTLHFEKTPAGTDFRPQSDKS